MNDSLSKTTLAALDIVRESGGIIWQTRGRPHDVRHKGPTDLVTETDLAVEGFLKERLSGLVPGACFLAEESAGDLALPDLCWIIDPVDGTTNFAHDVPFIGTSVALWDRDKGGCVLAIVNAPLLNECYTAEKGRGAFLNDRRIAVSKVDNPIEALAATGFPYDIAQKADEVLAVLRPVLRACQGVRRCGAASLDMAWVACGRFDAYFEAELKPWDTAAGGLLVTEAGGRVTDLEGAPFVPGSPVLASNGLLHARMLELLAQGRDQQN